VREKRRKKVARQNFPQHKERRSGEPTHASHLAFRRLPVLYLAMPGCLAHGLDSGEGSSIVSILPIRAALFPFFDTREACSLRGVCHELKKAVGDFPWEDMGTVIRGNISQWRACFPRAIGANVSEGDADEHEGGGRLTPVVDADFMHFVGLRALNMSWCWQVTDAAFVHLRGIERLNMHRCSQAAITDAAFVHLRGIQELDMGGCHQATITDAAFAHLVGIQRLSIFACSQATITDAAFTHLMGVRVLNMSHCRQLTDAAFEHLKGIHTLLMWDCRQAFITDAAFEHLKGIHSLVMMSCRQLTITGAGLEHLRGISRLGMYNCRAKAIAAAESLGLPTAKREYTRYGAFDTSFVEK
jgi:hypothetical protein